MPPLGKTERGMSCGYSLKQGASSRNEQYPVAYNMQCVTGYPTMYRYFDIPQPPPQNNCCSQPPPQNNCCPQLPPQNNCCRCCRCCCRQSPQSPPQQSTEEKTTQTEVIDTIEEETQFPEDPVSMIEEKLTVVTTKSVTRFYPEDHFPMDEEIPSNDSMIDKDLLEVSQSTKEKSIIIKGHSENEVALDALEQINTDIKEMEEANVKIGIDNNKDMNQGKPSIETDVKYTNEQPTLFSEGPVEHKDRKVNLAKKTSVTRIYPDGRVSKHMDILSIESPMNESVPESRSPEELDKPINTQKMQPEMAADEPDFIYIHKEEIEETKFESKTGSNKKKDTNEQIAPFQINSEQKDENMENVGNIDPINKFSPDGSESREIDMASKTDSKNLNSERKTSGMSDETPGEFKVPQVLKKSGKNPIYLESDGNEVTEIDTIPQYTEALEDDIGSRMNQPENISELSQDATKDSYLLDNTSDVTSGKEHGYEDYARDTESNQSSQKQDNSAQNINRPKKTKEINGEDRFETDIVLNESAEESNEEGENKRFEKSVLEESDDEADHREMQQESCKCCRMLPRNLPYNRFPFYCNQCLCCPRNIYGCMPWQAYPVNTEGNTPRWLPNCPPKRRQ